MENLKGDPTGNGTRNPSWHVVFQWETAPTTRSHVEEHQMPMEKEHRLDDTGDEGPLGTRLEA